MWKVSLLFIFGLSVFEVCVVVSVECNINNECTNSNSNTLDKAAIKTAKSFAEM